MKNCADSRGFSLIEVIVMLVMVSILSVMISSYFRSITKEIGAPFLRLIKVSDLSNVMENISAEYNREIKLSPTSLTAFKNSIGSIGEQDNDFGTYTVVENSYIRFNNANAEEADTGASPVILKVTIRNDINETLTALFTLF